MQNHPVGIKLDWKEFSFSRPIISDLWKFGTNNSKSFVDQHIYSVAPWHLGNGNRQLHHVSTEIDDVSSKSIRKWKACSQTGGISSKIGIIRVSPTSPIIWMCIFWSPVVAWNPICQCIETFCVWVTQYNNRVQSYDSGKMLWLEWPNLIHIQHLRGMAKSNVSDTFH